ncbi:uncharacterized protein LOC124459191 [Xenia sp. Carnegie-2017]|uniref:uncharacterized protein LOC124459191 n=1 Tax=Xenia sp. Carnegie-2017 TaxID=2897299 RepID=UPI001F048F0C|nr:uncharacterized protein LOC124459191 [Xenia sp. Carnegie-2017]
MLCSDGYNITVIDLSKVPKCPQIIKYFSQDILYLLTGHFNDGQSESRRYPDIDKDRDALTLTFYNVVQDELDMSESDRITNIIRAKFVLLQTLGIATSHSHKWSRDMFPEISLIVYCLEQFIIYILQNEKNVDALSEDIVKFFISCCETFRWDIVYQNCQRLLV